MSEWSVPKPGKMSALEVVDIKLELIKKKSGRHCFSGFPFLQVKGFVSTFRRCQMSVRSKESTIYLPFYKDFLCVTGFPTVLSFFTSKTRLKSPPKIISSHSKVKRHFKTFSKKKRSSLFGVHIFANVNFLLSVFMSTIMNLPFGSELVLRMWKEKVLFKSMLTLALALERLLKIAEYPHSEVQHFSLSFEQWTSHRNNIAYFLVFSHQNISHLFTVLDSPFTFNEIPDFGCSLSFKCHAF